MEMITNEGRESDYTVKDSKEWTDSKPGKFRNVGTANRANKVAALLNELKYKGGEWSICTPISRTTDCKCNHNHNNDLQIV